MNKFPALIQKFIKTVKEQALLKHSENKRTNFLKKSIDLFFQYKSF